MSDSPLGPQPAPLAPPALPAIYPVSAPAVPLEPFDGLAFAPSAGAAVPPAHPTTTVGFHPYFDEIKPVFYNYRLADYNRRYHAFFLEQAKRKNARVQIVSGVMTGVAVVLLSLPAAVPDETVLAWVHRLNPIAALLSALAFLITFVAPMFGWDKEIDDYTVRIHAWQFAESQIETALRFLIHEARSARDAELQVRSANSAFTVAGSLPQVGQDDPEVSVKIKQDVENAIPPDYLWIAF
jgi:hypothetical protein